MEHKFQKGIYQKVHALIALLMLHLTPFTKSYILFCSVVHPGAERGATAGAQINMGNHFLDMMGKGKEMSTATIQKVNEEHAPSSMESVCRTVTLQKPWSDWDIAWTVLDLGVLSSTPTYIGGFNDSVDFAAASCHWHTSSFIQINTGNSEIPNKSALLIPRKNKKKGTSEWIQGVSTDLKKKRPVTNLIPNDHCFYFEEFISFVKILYAFEYDLAQAKHF